MLARKQLSSESEGPFGNFLISSLCLLNGRAVIIGMYGIRRGHVVQWVDGVSVRLAHFFTKPVSGCIETYGNGSAGRHYAPVFFALPFLPGAVGGPGRAGIKASGRAIISAAPFAA